MADFSFKFKYSSRNNTPRAPINSIQLLMYVSCPWYSMLKLKLLFSRKRLPTYMFYLKLTVMLLNVSLLQGCITIVTYKISTPRARNVVLFSTIHRIVGFFEVLNFCEFRGFDRFVKFKPSKNCP